MISRARARASRFLLVSTLACAASAIAAGCSEDAADDQPRTTVPPAPTATVGRDAAPGLDSSTVVNLPDTGPIGDQDACADGGCVKPKGCAARPTAAFCDDFDNAGALTAGTTKWDFIEPTDQPVATLSSLQAVSTPSSLLSRIIDGTTPGAKFAKTVTKAGFTETTWEYDVYFDNIGTSDGFFLDDFQFTDAVGPDTYGFRLVMFANAGAIAELKVEHNQQANGGPYVIEPPLAAGTVQLGKWHHFKQTVKLSFAGGDAGADAGDGGNVDAAEYSLTIDDAAAPQFSKKYPGLTRVQAAFVRFAGLPLVFNKGNSAGLKIHWDNQVLELK